MSEDSSFRDLLRRVREGEEQAAVELVNGYLPQIRVVARRRLRDPSLRGLVDSMDICQSILATFFVRAALGQFELDTPEQLLKLLATMVINRVRNEKEKQEAARRDRRRNLKDSPAARAFVDPRPTPGQVAANQELLHEVQQRLSEEERQIADLHNAGHSWAEIAAQLGGSPNALRMRYHRAIDRVMKELGVPE